MEDKLGNITSTIAIPDQVKKYDPVGFESVFIPVK